MLHLCRNSMKEEHPGSAARGSGIRKREAMNDFYVLLFAVAVLWGIRPARPLTGFHDGYLSIQTTSCWRGILCVIVIFSHLAQTTSGGFLFQRFHSAGYLAVSIFFFYSGFGLMKKHIHDPHYQEGFLKRRLVPLLVPYAIVTAVYWLVYTLTGAIYTPKVLLYTTFVQGSGLVAYAWYIHVIVLYYVAFWALMKLFPRSNAGILWGSFLVYVLHVALCRKIGYATVWYNTAFLPVFGMIWARWEEPLTAFLKKHYLPVFLAAAAGFLGASLVQKIPVALVQLVAYPTLRGILFCILVMLFSMKFQVGNPVLCFLGKYSMGMYLFHQLTMEYSPSIEPLRIGWVLITSALLALLLQKVCKRT